MKKAVLWKEVRAIVRDGRLAVLATALLLILISVLIGSNARYQRLSQEKRDVERVTREQWDTQGDKHPHRGAHFGIYVFRPESALSVINPGVTDYLGQALWLEPHHRNPMRFSPAEDAPPSIRFGSPTPAFVLTALLPILILGMSFNSISHERESGTLRMLHSAGLSTRTLVLGKLLAQLGMFGILLLVILSAGYVLSLDGLPSSDEILRGLSMGVGYLIYYLVFSALALAVSAFVRSSRLALFILIGLWALFVFVAPRIGGSLAESMVPLPAPEKFWSDIKRDYENGLPGDEDLKTQVKKLEERLLKEHNVTRLEDLPFGYNPVRRMFRDAYNDKVHAYHFNALADRYAQQQQILRLASILSPSVAMNAFSMKMAGTDLAHQQHFENATEEYRRYFNTKIDRWDADNTKGLTSFELKYADNSVWQSIEKFHYTAPHAGFAWKQALPDFLVLLGWLAFVGALLGVAARRMKP